MAVRKRKTTKRKKKPAKRLTVTQKWNQLKRQTEQAGMTVTERNGKIVASRKKKRTVRKKRK